MSNIEFKMTSPSDVAAAIPLMHSSGPYSFDYVFCDSYQAQGTDYLAKAFVESDIEFSHQHHLGLYLEGELVALGSIKTSAQNAGFMVAAVKSFFEHYSFLTALGVLWRGFRTEAVICPPNKQAAVLCNLGVEQSHRGLGLGSKLITALEERARTFGYTTVELDVAANNPKAKALYERLGYQDKHVKTSELRSKFGFVPSHTRMTKSLPTV